MPRRRVALGALGAGALGQAASGPFTQAQATAGRQAFEDNCAACHLQDLSGTNEDLKVLFAVGYRVAQADKMPEWKPGNEFRAKREQMLKK